MYKLQKSNKESFSAFWTNNLAFTKFRKLLFSFRIIKHCYCMNFLLLRPSKSTQLQNCAHSKLYRVCVQLLKLNLFRTYAGQNLFNQARPFFLSGEFDTTLFNCMDQLTFRQKSCAKRKMSSCSLIQVYKYITHSIAKIKKAFFLFQLFDGHKSQSILVPINFSPDSIKKHKRK